MNTCDKCGKETTDLENCDYSWPNFNYDFCRECAKDQDACDAFIENKQNHI